MKVECTRKHENVMEEHQTESRQTGLLMVHGNRVSLGFKIQITKAPKVLESIS